MLESKTLNEYVESLQKKIDALESEYLEMKEMIWLIKRMRKLHQEIGLNDSTIIDLMNKIDKELKRKI